jgi:N-acetylglucosaminyl-diphospho-decaprenol L-rhamnosyltransferase
MAGAMTGTHTANLSTNEPATERNIMTGRVGATIVNYNAGDDLLACVQSLRDQGVQDISVSDNGSSDDSLERLAARFPDVIVNHLPNPGYGGGMNGAAAHVSNEFVFIINPDAAVLPGAVDAFLQRMDSDPEIGIIGPRTQDPDGSLYPSVRRFPNLVDGIGHAVLGPVWKNNPFTKRYRMINSDHDQFSEVDWVSGAAMFTRRAAFDQINGFDDDYWMYMEDVDLCYRMHEAGWKVVYDPQAKIVHAQGTSTTKTARRFIFTKAHHESVLKYQRKHATGIDRKLYPVIFAGMKVRLAIAWVKNELQKRKK